MLVVESVARDDDCVTAVPRQTNNRRFSTQLTLCLVNRTRQGHSYKFRLLHGRDVNETLAYETETRPRPRPCKAETETFFETFNLQDCAKTMNGDVQIKTIYIKQYRYLVFTVYSQHQS